MKVVKIGYINSEELLYNMPEVKTADEQLQKLSNDYDVQLQKLGEEYNKLIEEINPKLSTMNEAEQEMAAQKLQTMEANITQFQEKARNAISKKQKELYDPIIKKANDAIKLVAKEMGYTLIMDTSFNNLLYFDETDDIIAHVCKKLGITYTKPTTGQ